MLEDMRRRDDLVLGMVTGKSRRGVRSIVETHGFDGVFMTVRTADDCPSKPHPAMVLECCAETGIEPGETVVIGDTVYDIDMARSAGARAIGVSWGNHDAERLKAAGADRLARTPGELAALLK
jgi:phosphoglycolate phosphatase